ncbi:hypothetical protein KJ654_04630 [Patescibacteria group bacterium]|nr:hypothetical protein [Patescibacteria group bacterium]
MTFPVVSSAAKLQPDSKRLFIGAYGFEQRSLGWSNYQKEQGDILNLALLFRYVHPKGKNRIKELRLALTEIGVSTRVDIPYNVYSPHNIEDIFSQKLGQVLSEIDEVIVDISAMTKLLILGCLCALDNFEGDLRIVYSEGNEYAPTKSEYEISKDDMEMIAKFPSRGIESIIRMKCLSSIRMQGQPVTMVAFTSFNEQLVRHMLGTISPHRLVFINGRPPRKDFAWRERATQEIYKRLIEEYRGDNPLNQQRLLARVASTLKYNETIDQLNKIHEQFGTHERIICAATGSKMQTVGLFFAKMMHPDIHIEYPTPDSYFVKGICKGVQKVHEIVVPRFSEFLKSISQ